MKKASDCASASLIGTTVTGSFFQQFGAGPNFFDEANGEVPAGFLNSAPNTPTVIVASDDDADPEHPRAVGETYAQAIPGARLVTDEPGRSPIAWQGSQLSKLIAEVVDEASL